MTSTHPSGRKKILLFIVGTILIDSIGFGIIIPVLPRLVMELGHVGLAEATRIGGWLATVYALMQFLCGPIAGNLGDRFGRRPVLLLALGGFAIDYLILGFAATLAWLFAGRAIAGVLGLAGILLLWGIASMVYPATWSYFAIAQYGWSTGTIGASLALAGVSMALVQTMVLGRVIARFRERRTAMIGVSVAMVGYAILAFNTSPLIGFAIVAVTALQALVQPSITALMSQRAPADAQGEMQGFIGSLNSVAAIAGPMLLNPTLAYFTGPSAPVHFPGAAFVIASSFAFLALVALALTGKVRDQIPSGTGS